MTWNEFRLEYNRSLVETNNQKKFRLGIHPRVWLKVHKHFRKYAFHTVILTSVILAVVTMDKSQVFASVELSITLIAHTYAVVANLLAGRKVEE